MTDAEILLEMQRLYAVLQRTKPYTKAYDKLVAQIRTLADLYNAHAD